MRTVLVIMLAMLASCESDCENAPDLERMIHQPRAEAFEASPFFPDGRAMRPLVPGTVSRTEIVGRPELTEGLVGEEYVKQIPIPVTRAFVERGQGRFQIYCATCHGVLGDGTSQVAENMTLRRPPSLHLPHIRAYPPGRLYAVIKHGYGFMRSYAAELPLEDRWATVAYVQALQRSQLIELESLPAELRTEAQKWLN